FGERLAVYSERPIPASDPQIEARLSAALAESADLRIALDTERTALNERLAHAKAEFGSVLATMRRSAEETEYGYAQRVANLEIERDAQLATAQAETETAQAEHQARLHQLGTEIQQVNKALAESQAKVVALDGQIASLTTQYEIACDARDAIHTLHDEESAALDAARADVEQTRGMLTIVVDERDSLKEQVETTGAELGRLRSVLATVQRERDAYKTTLDDVRARAQEFEELFAIADGELSATARDRAVVKLERNAALSELEIARVGLTNAGDKVVALDGQIASLTAQYEMACDALDAARADVEQTRGKLVAMEMSVRTLVEERDQLLVTQRERQQHLEDAIVTAGKIEHRFVDHVRGAIDQTRAESERTMLLLDTVQSSVFWKMKRWFSLRRAR
ncbi:MAG: hypothetical protein M3R30_04845, partial [Candidatus Eremiobacteraeota bacterium]|nr:hypothetical protein [Candidatus Eremiobacteraeota bacterium]